MFTPIINQKQLIINSSGDTAVCTCWSPLTQWERLVEKYQIKEKIAVIGNLYDPCGVGNMVRNLAANPQIKKLYFIGQDLNGYLMDAVYEAYSKGIDLQCADHKNVHMKLNWLSIIDASKGVKYEPEQQLLGALHLHPPKQTFDVFEAPCHGFMAYGSSLKEVWDQVRFYLQNFGTRCPSPYGDTFETIGISTILSELDFSAVDFKMPEEYFESYANNLINHVSSEGVSYTYGGRLNGVFNLGDRLSGRQAFLPIYRPIDQFLEEPPCFVSCWFRICQNKLVGVFSFRSQDMCQGYPLNVYGLRKVQEKLAQINNLECGDTITHTFSAHLYERDYDENLKSYEVPDPIGNFVISIEDDYIQVDLYHNNQLIYSTTGASANVLEKKLHLFLHNTSHALYLGRELYKAELKLKQKKEVTPEPESSWKGKLSNFFNYFTKN